MSKLRIYELAKELGVENRVVIAKATELGMQGKASHSNSLDPDEADKLRRAILRQSVGVPSKSEVVTTRVDKTTGTAQAIVESRSGNVIRRRKAPPGPPSQGGEGVESGVAVASASSSSGGLEEVQTNGHHQTAVIHAELPVEEAVEEAEETPPVEATPVSNAEVVDAPADEIEVEVVESVPEAPPVQAAAAATQVVEAKKPAIGPKVLGKIALPQKKVVKQETKKGVVAGVSVIPIEDDEEEIGKKGAKKKTKKREINRFDLVDYEGRDSRRTRGSKSKVKEEQSEKKQADAAKTKQSKKVVEFNESITVGELAKQMSLKAGEVIAKLMELGMMATINQALDFDTASIVAQEFEFQVESTSFDETEILNDTASDDKSEGGKPRPPVVTVMGHVDHGKTSLLDSIRNASVATGEHGGITQHIGAYSVVLPDQRSITFIDTPGHAAFTSMRARGAQVTDIVILVVAADEGVMPQTVEAINHAKAAKVPIVVAMNKMDKPNSNPDKLKQQLAEHGLNPEEWGGDTMYMPVSALKKTGIKELLEALLLIAEMKELKANADRRAKGAIIEAKQDKGRGSVATVLIQTGTLRVGDIFVCGADFGKVRSMIDSHGEKLESAGPSCPVEITGFNGNPDAGDDFFVVESDSNAREVAQNRAEKKRAKEQRALATGPISLEEFARRANNLAMAELNVILKADVQGSAEAVRDSLEKLSTEKVKVRVLHANVGGVNESDVQLAIASKAIIVGFGVRAEPRALQDAELAGIDVRFYRIIYEVMDDVKKAMAGLLAPLKKEVPLGRAEVRNTFNASKIGTIAGCFVTDGLVRRSAHVRLLRDNRVIHEGKMGSLRRFKDDAREVTSGYECGIGIEGYNDIKVGDVIDVYEIEEVAQTID